MDFVLRPIALGRRNSLFSGNEGGAESWGDTFFDLEYGKAARGTGASLFKDK